MEVWEFIKELFPRLRHLFNDWLGGFFTGNWGWIVIVLDALIGILLILLFVLSMVMVLVYIERRGIGRFQIRLGPNRAGPRGILQPVADVIKLFTKEDIVPAKGDRWVHWLAPVVMIIPMLLVFAVVPVQEGGIFVDLNIGILYIIAIGTLGIIGIFMAGWASNNKFSLVGAMRAVAQLVSYEIPMVLSIIGVVMVAESLSMVSIVKAQAVPFLLLQPLGLLIYFIGATAELNRSPMDLLEAESEIVAGYHTEYSGMKWALFFLAEFGNTVAISAIVATLFLGGWRGPVLPPYLWFLLKTFAVYFVLLWMRSTLPRLRVDQLMGFAWKFLFPLALINLFLCGAEVLVWQQWFPGWETFPWPFIFVNLAVAGALVVFWARLFFKPGASALGAPSVKGAPRREVKVGV